MTKEQQVTIWQNMAAKYSRQAQSCRDSGAGHAEYFQTMAAKTAAMVRRAMRIDQ